MGREVFNDSRFPFSFARSGANGVDLWAPEPNGDWSEDNGIGRAYADELVRFMRERGDPAMLGRVVQAMIARGSHGGVEVGFCQRIGETCV